MAKWLRIVFLFAISGMAAAQAPESPTVRVGLLGIAANIPVLIADKHRYFKDEGLNNVVWLTVRALVEKRGGDPRKLSFIEVPFPQMLDALLNDRVDAIANIEPF